MIKLSRISLLGIAKQYFSQGFVRGNSSKSQMKSLVHLDQRTLLRLSGYEVSDFLQGLITNDIRHLKEGAASIYSVFLNIKGRVLYDTIIYKTQDENVFYVECDSSIVNTLSKHLKMYKLRRKVDIQREDDSMKVWTAYNHDTVFQAEQEQVETKSNLEGKIFPCGSSDNASSKLVDNIFIYSDPRIYTLGLRILTQSTVTRDEIIKHLEPNVTTQQNASSYRQFRYKLGVGEGVQDLPPGTSFPLEINCDYLHGISFHKGCYIGQELTARTHHTGVVRKRLMPLIFNQACEKPLKYDDKITNEAGKIVGKIRGQEGIFGLGLIRIADALTSKTLTVGDCILKVVKPHWWPQESSSVEASLKTSKN